MREVQFCESLTKLPTAANAHTRATWTAEDDALHIWHRQLHAFAQGATGTLQHDLRSSRTQAISFGKRSSSDKAFPRRRAWPKRLPNQPRSAEFGAQPDRHVQTSEHSQKVSGTNQHAPLRRRRTSLPRGVSGCHTSRHSIHFRNPCSADGQSDPAPDRSACRWCHKTLLGSENSPPGAAQSARASKVNCPKLVRGPFDHCHARLLPPCDSQKSTHTWRLHSLATRRWCDRCFADRHNFDGQERDLNW